MLTETGIVFKRGNTGCDLQLVNLLIPVIGTITEIAEEPGQNGICLRIVVAILGCTIQAVLAKRPLWPSQLSRRIWIASSSVTRFSS